MGQKELQASNLERDRGILTPEDRKFLLGKINYEHPQSARRRRAKIRERVTNAFLDFDILRYMEDRDRDQVFAPDDDEARIQFGIGFASAFIFLYDALVRSWEDYEDVDNNLNNYLEQAIEAVDQSRGYRTEVETTIEREELDDPNEIFQRAKQEGIHTLTDAEFELLWSSPEVDAAAFVSFLNQLFEDVDDYDLSVMDIQNERQAIQQMREQLE